MACVASLISRVALGLSWAAFICLPVRAAVPESPEDWYQQGETALRDVLKLAPNTGRAKNIVLFIGDGMGVSTVTAARIYAGQQQGQPGEEYQLAFEKLPHMALLKTYNTNQQTPDSAGTMSAIMTGVKTRAGVISVNQRAQRGDCISMLGNEQETLLEAAEKLGRSTGIVTTARLTHATPAATYAHLPERNWENDADMPGDANTAGCKDVASQLIAFSHGDGVEVALGGGRRNFFPTTQAGERQDERNLIDEWLKRYPKASYVQNRAQLDDALVNGASHLLGLFQASHMSYEKDRDDNPDGEPSLAEMTVTAIKLLKRNSKGFFLMVEGGRIDHAHHANNAHRALAEVVAFDEAVKAALDMADSQDTLIVVTADHSHALTMAGYSDRGNPILGKAVNVEAAQSKRGELRAKDKRAYTTLGYHTGPGAAVRKKRENIKKADTSSVDYKQQALVPLGSAAHSGEDVAVYASGPWAHLFQGAQEQHYIYHVMRHAAGFDK